jgi:DNA modification methylase
VTLACACEHCGHEFDADPEGGHRLLCGDSTSVDDVERLMDGKRAILVATDPPYLVNYGGGSHPQSRSNSPDVKDSDWTDKYREVNAADADEFFVGFIATAIAAAVGESALWYIWHADRRALELAAAMRKCGLLVHQTIIWVKGRPVLTYSHFMQAHEPCLYGWMEGHAPPKDRRPAASERSVWEIPSKIEDGVTGVHPTQKPIEIIARPIEYHTKPGELIYEPFSGSGTAFIAAEKEGRVCYGMELSAGFVDVIVERWAKFTGRLAVLANDGRTFDELAAERHDS